MATLFTDTILHQDPPPYGPPIGVLVVPAVEYFADPHTLHPSAPPSPGPRATSSPSRVRSTASLQLTPVQARPGTSHAPPRRASPPPGSPASRPRSRTINGSPSPGTRKTTRTHPRRTSFIGNMSAPSSSPPPYSLTPPEVHLINPAKRASSSPHLRLSASSSSHLPPHLSSAHSRHAFSEHARGLRPINPTSDDDETSGSGAETDDGVMFRRTSQGVGSLADTLRHRLMGKGKARAFDEGWSRPISTTPGASCAGETETEGEDSVRAPFELHFRLGRP